MAVKKLIKSVKTCQSYWRKFTAMYLWSTTGHFTSWIRLSLSHKFGLRPKISQKVKSFFRLAETKLWTERLLYPKLSNSPVDFACTRCYRLEIKFLWTKINLLFRLFTNKQKIRRYQRRRQWWHGVSSDVRCSDWLIWTPVWDKSWAVWSVFGLSERLIKKVKWPNIMPPPASMA